MAVAVQVTLRTPHGAQRKVQKSGAKRKICRGGRRSGKTTILAEIGVEAFLAGKRVLYAAPTTEQGERFWAEVKKALVEPISNGIYGKNEGLHLIERPGTDARIRAKTAWNPDMLRGDYADLLILDEWQLCNEAMWSEVGLPMLLDTNGDAIFAYTPPSLFRKSVIKAKDPRHAAKLFKKAQEDTTGRWEAFHFTSYDNPHLTTEAIEEIHKDMTETAFRQEILAEDIEDVPGALWKYALIDPHRVDEPIEDLLEQLVKVIVAVDPSGTKRGDEAGVIAAGLDRKGHVNVWGDRSGQLSPDGWGQAAVDSYYDYDADCIVAEHNFGADMVKSVIRGIDKDVPVYTIRASRGKQIRAQPVVAKYEQGKVHHVGEGLGLLEKELTEWVPRESAWSPGRLDALVHAVRFLTEKRRSKPRAKSLR